MSFYIFNFKLHLHTCAQNTNKKLIKRSKYHFYERSELSSIETHSFDMIQLFTSEASSKIIAVKTTLLTL